MKIRMTVATVALLALSVLGAGLVSAHGNPQANPPTSHRELGYRAHCTPAVAGGWIKVQAKVFHPVRGKTYTASAVAALTPSSGVVALHRVGKSYIAVGKIAVPATQPVGPVVVTVTITYDGTPHIVTCTSNIHLAEADNDSDKD